MEQEQRSKVRNAEILDRQQHLDNFITAHKNFLDGGHTGIYQRSHKYRGRAPRYSCTMENFMATSGSKLWVPGQSFVGFFADTGTVSPNSYGENPEIDFLDVTILEEQPASPHVGLKTKAKLSSRTT